MLEDIMALMIDKMEKSIVSMNNEFSKIITNRVNPSLIKDIRVNYYDSKVSLDQISVVLADSSNVLLVKPFDKKLLQNISKEIVNLNLGLNPIIFGDSIKVVFPKLTEERRIFYAKKIRKIGEDIKIAIRNVRKNVNQKFKSFLKEENMSKDDEKRCHLKIQEISDAYIKKVDSSVFKKEEELLCIR
ncbi:MAG TPA: ribosome recycling factor [Candidatus Azoamicus sp. OHIO1]